MTEFTRRIDRGIYDHEEFERAMVWVKEHIKEGVDRNREDLVLSPEKKQNMGICSQDVHDWPRPYARQSSLG